jgi:hypothetical protein
MKPSEIQSLLNQAKAARELSPAGIHTFALYWITWEAYRTRMLAVAARLRGWRIEDAYFAIGAKRISSQTTYKRCFKDITSVQLAEQSGLLGSAWNLIDEIEVLRHRLIHGHRSANPALIEQASQFLDSILTHQEKVFSKLLIPVKDGTLTKLGNVLAQRPGAGRGIATNLDRQSLLTHLKLENQTPAKLPEHDTILKRLANVVETLG